MGREIVVGMSGGVDSSMSLVALKEKGFRPTGISLKLPVWKNKENSLRQNVCCSKESLDIAAEVCRRTDVAHHVFDVRKDFRKEVIGYFVSELKNHRTPNPCVACNRRLKFRKLFEWAEKHGIKHVATGHYAKTRFNPSTKKHELLRPKDKSKDQTYGLSFLRNEWLKNIVFPLGDRTKKQVYDLAREKGFRVFLKRKQSQDLCFVSGKALPKFIEEKVGVEEGEIADTRGNVLGTHRGLSFYTIGQKKGVGLAGKYYVKAFEVVKNRLVVTRDKKTVRQTEVTLSPFNFVSGLVPTGKTSVLAKVRYRQPLQKAVLFPQKNGSLRVVFKTPSDSVSPGQFCVFYRGNVCLGAGAINSSR